MPYVFRSPRAKPRRREETRDFSVTLRLLREELGWTQETLAARLGVSRRTLVSWECGYWLPPVKQRVHVLLALHGVPPEYLLDLAAALGVSTDEAIRPLLDPLERACDAEEEAHAALLAPAPQVAPRPSPDALRAAVDVVVRTSADALDVRASDLRAAVTRVLAACAELGADIDEVRGAVEAPSASKGRATS
jgi:transcriptional regulator with XRE-family HTH domain